MKKLILLIFLGGCAYKPMHDPTSSTAKSYYDDLQHCRFLVEQQTSIFEYGYYEVKYEKEKREINRQKANRR